MTSTRISAVHQRRLGRPREFDLDTVLEAAVRVFRERGYQATSVSDLVDATGLTAGSLYKAFGDKRNLFAAAFERYVDGRNAQLRQRLDAAPNGREKIHAMLRFYAESSHGSEGRRGCLVASSASALATFDDELAARIEATMRRSEEQLRKLIQEGQGDGSIAVTVPVAATARNLLALLHGFRVIGKSGRTRADMLAAADDALRLLA
jgi:AcrR family transcriptional regulator